MSAKRSKVEKGEEMLLRVIRVAEILAKGESEAGSHTKQQTKPAVKSLPLPSTPVEKTQI